MATFQAARVLAQRILLEGGDTPQAKVKWSFEQVLSRPPDTIETQIISTLYQQHLAHFKANPTEAKAVLTNGETPASTGDPATLAAWTSVTRTLLNLHEAITRM